MIVRGGGGGELFKEKLLWKQTRKSTFVNIQKKVKGMSEKI